MKFLQKSLLKYLSQRYNVSRVSNEKNTKDTYKFQYIGKTYLINYESRQSINMSKSLLFCIFRNWVIDYEIGQSIILFQFECFSCLYVFWDNRLSLRVINYRITQRAPHVSTSRIIDHLGRQSIILSCRFFLLLKRFDTQLSSWTID